MKTEPPEHPFFSEQPRPHTQPMQHAPVSPLTEAGEVFNELLSYALVIIIEASFMCLWGGVLWAVTHVLDLIEGCIPHNTWAPTLFKHAEIGFAVFILCNFYRDALMSLRQR